MATRRTDGLFTTFLAVVGAGMPFFAQAQTGLYVGAGIGLTDQQVALDPLGDFGVTTSVDNDLAWKVFAGINLDVPFIDLALEAGYVDLGSPDADIQGVVEASLDTTGFDAFAVGAIDVGPAAVFAKVGVVAWDLDISVPDLSGLGESGTNFAGGVGARFTLGSLQIRGEAEYFAIDEVDNSYLFSTSLVWVF